MSIGFHIIVQSLARLELMDEPTRAPMDIVLGDCVAARYVFMAGSIGMHLDTRGGSEIVGIWVSRSHCDGLSICASSSCLAMCRVNKSER
jgi:hypothetical protein